MRRTDGETEVLGQGLGDGQDCDVHFPLPSYPIGTANPFLVTQAPGEGDDDSPPMSNVDIQNTSVKFFYTSVLRRYGQRSLSF